MIQSRKEKREVMDAFRALRVAFAGLLNAAIWRLN
jgi:hypothetical protein